MLSLIAPAAISKWHFFVLFLSDLEVSGES
jgi:hypothetical protein